MTVFGSESGSNGVGALYSNFSPETEKELNTLNNNCWMKHKNGLKLFAY